MINQYEMPFYLVKELPEIETELKETTTALNVFKTAQCLVHYTKEKIKAHDMNTVKRVMNAAEKIYMEGNNAVKNALENVFVFSFTSFICMCDREEKNTLQAIMPLHLYSAYILQVYRSGN
jgi:hypothetical protein